ncbi:MAG: hypothetical protein IID34_06965 [Planctomycetes bacterium]|nr:hypothetical protein [Planctomycetota bacterium]MCH8912846.1 hypothetical protein [Planctomycetota bacterium]MCH8965178.1 hypothetical protein [Planctomycetota bacterium]MCH8969965.1 hypothetical protein [Planctomycetota bacterium]MCZ6651948.1 hypothetical protein [Planctomycetota bacterium]
MAVRATNQGLNLSGIRVAADPTGRVLLNVLKGAIFSHPPKRTEDPIEICHRSQV